jgi:hypothetical protein
MGGTYRTQLLVSNAYCWIPLAQIQPTFPAKGKLSPILKRLSVLHNFTIESQVQFHAPLAFKPQLIQADGGDAYGVTSEDLTVFINSAEWTLCEALILFCSIEYMAK